MKPASYHLLVCLTALALSSCQEKSAEDILTKSLTRIENIKTVEQVLVIEDSDLANYHLKTDTSVHYFDFRNPVKTMGSRYHCPGTYLSGDRPTNNYRYKIAKLMDVGYGKRAFTGSGRFFYPMFGSIDAVKRFLPGFLSDSSAHITRLRDTTINGQGIHYHINCSLMNKGIQPGGKIYDVSFAEDHYVSSFDRFINKKRSLPAVIEYI